MISDSRKLKENMECKANHTMIKENLSSRKTFSCRWFNKFLATLTYLWHLSNYDNGHNNLE